MDFSVADELGVTWERQDIPDIDLLWMRVHRMWLGADGKVFPGAFKNRPSDKDGMSTDWQKYATPEQTRNRAKTPKDNAVIQFVVGAVRKVADQTVVHTPDRATNNRAHTDVYGEKHTEARLQLSRIYTPVISVEP